MYITSIAYDHLPDVDTNEPLDPNYFEHFLVKCSLLGIPHTHILRDLNFQIPDKTFSDKALLEFNK